MFKWSFLNPRVAELYRHIKFEIFFSFFPFNFYSTVALTLCIKNPKSLGGGEGMSLLQRPDYYAENTALPDRRAKEPPLGRGARVQSVVVNKRGEVLWN